MKAKVPICPEKGGIENSHSAQLKFKTGSTPESNSLAPPEASWDGHDGLVLWVVSPESDNDIKTGRGDWAPPAPAPQAS